MELDKTFLYAFNAFSAFLAALMATLADFLALTEAFFAALANLTETDAFLRAT